MLRPSFSVRRFYSPAYLLYATLVFTGVLMRSADAYGTLNCTNPKNASTCVLVSDTVPKVGPESTSGDGNYVAPTYPILNFTQYADNPILASMPQYAWESAFVFNPAAIVVGDMVWLLYRAQDQNLTSSIGLGWSTDGFHFTAYSKPVVFATESYELLGGTEDPRIIRVNGTFYLTYTAYDQPASLARLCLATSTDLINWTKYGPILPDWEDVVYVWNAKPFPYYYPRKGWSKSGAIIPERQPDGYYYMQFGDVSLYTARSTDLIYWNYTTGGPPFAARLNVWELALTESGPPPVKTKDGKWIKFYNGVAEGLGGYAAGQYSTGEMLIDPANAPYGPPLARLDTPVLQPTTQDEQVGQTNNVVFSEGLVQYKGQWLLYYGASDSFVGVASAPAV